MAYSIFISCSTKDLPHVDQVRRILGHPSISVFVAEYALPLGAPLKETVVHQIKNCDLFLLLWSEYSKASEWVPPEIGGATGANKTIIPFILDANCPPPAFVQDLKYLQVDQDPQRALAVLQHEVFARAQKKQQTDGLVWLGLGAAALYLLSGGK